MNDFELAANNIGNRFDLVLVASERMREIYRTRNKQLETGTLTEASRRGLVPPCQQAVTDIEHKIVGIEYLDKIKSRTRKKKPRFDEI